MWYLAARSGRDLVEVNFERDPRRGEVFAGGDPRQMLADLGLFLGRTITPERSLIFLDEIQSAPAVLGSLRWFAEELPELDMSPAIGEPQSGVQHPCEARRAHSNLRVWS